MTKEQDPKKQLEPLRVHAVSFLNARPLLHSLTGDKAPRLPDGRLMFELHEALPSDCADALARGDADLALIPVATLVDHPDWEVVPDIGIGCQGAVETVVLAAAAPLEEIRRLLNPTGVPEFEACATVGTGVFETLKAVARAVLSDLKQMSK